MPETRHPYLTPTYIAYLASAHWWNLKRDLWRFRGYRCTVCQCKNQVDPHHLIYRLPLTDGRVTDLMPLCRRCHAIVHDNFLPATFTDNTPVHERWTRTEAFIRKKLAEEEARKSAPKPTFRSGLFALHYQRGRWQNYAACQQAEAEEIRSFVAPKKQFGFSPINVLPKWEPPITARPSKTRRWFDI